MHKLKLNIVEGFKKNKWYLSLGEGGGISKGQLSLSFFLFLMSHKSFLDTKVFSSIGVGGPLGAHQAPLWSLANIKCDVANFTYGTAVILHGPAIILRGMTSMHEILPIQHQFF